MANLNGNFQIYMNYFLMIYHLRVQDCKIVDVGHGQLVIHGGLASFREILPP